MLRIGLFLLTNIAVLALALLIMSVLGVGGYLDETGTGLNLTHLLIFCAIFGFAGAFVSLLISKPMAKWSTRTQVITQPRNAQEQWLLQTVEDLARRAGIGMPEVGIFPAAEANAFATGWNRNKALVAVSQGMLQRFDRDEVRAVMAHEIGHVANGDMITLALLQGVVNTFVMFFARIIGHFVDRVVFRNNSGHGLGYIMVVLVAQVVLGILASMIVMAFSRYREYRADAAGASLADRQSMIRALQRLKAEVEAGVQNPMPDTMKAFGISEGFSKHMSKLFASHPPLDQRIAVLSRGY